MQLIRAITAATAIACAFPGAGLARDAEGIRDSGRLIVCANGNAMPVSSDGELPGFQLELAREIANDLGVRLSVEWIWAGYQIRYTDCDMILGVARDTKPGGFVRFVQALTDVEILIAVPGEPHPVTAADLAGKIVAVPSTTLAHFKLLDLGADPRVAYRSDADILQAIADGVVDAGVVNSMALGWFTRQNPDVKMFSVSTEILDVVSAYPMTIGLRKMDSLGESEFQEIVAAMRADGRLEAILEKYGQTLSQSFDDPYAKVPDEISEPSSVTVRKDIIEELEDRVRTNAQ